MAGIHFKSNRTGDAWWPVEHTAVISFEDGQIYRIYGQVFKADSTPFRIAWENAWRQNTWDIISKKGL